MDPQNQINCNEKYETCFKLIQGNENLPKDNQNKIIAELSKIIGSNQTSPLKDSYLVGRVKAGLEKTNYGGIAGAIKKFVHSFVNLFKLGEFTTTDDYIENLIGKTTQTGNNKKIIDGLTLWAKIEPTRNKEEAVNRILTALSKNETYVDLTVLNLDPKKFPEIEGITLLHFNQEELKQVRGEDNECLQEFERKEAIINAFEASTSQLSCTEVELTDKIGLALEYCYSEKDWQEKLPPADAVELKNKFKAIMNDENKLKKFLFNLRNSEIDSMKYSAEVMKGCTTKEAFFERANVVSEPTELTRHGIGFVQCVAHAVIKTNLQDPNVPFNQEELNKVRDEDNKYLQKFERNEATIEDFIEANKKNLGTPIRSLLSNLYEVNTDAEEIIKGLTSWVKSGTDGNKEEAIKLILTALLKKEKSVELTGLNLKDVPDCGIRARIEQPIKPPKKENAIPTENVKIKNSSKIKYPNSRELFEWSDKMENKQNRKEVFQSIKRGDPKLDLSTFKLEEFPPLDLAQLSRIKTIEHKDLKELFEWTKKGDPKNKIQAFFSIYNCARNQKPELHISNLNLTELPSLRFLSQLKTLNVSGNQLPQKEINKLNTELLKLFAMPVEIIYWL